MKVTYGQLNNAELISAFKEVRKIQLPIKAAYRFGKIADKLDGLVTDFQKRYAAICKEAAKKDEEGKPTFKRNEKDEVIGYIIQDELAEAISKTYMTMLSEEVELGVHAVEFDMIKDVSISVDTLMALEPFITGMTD